MANNQDQMMFDRHPDGAQVLTADGQDVPPSIGTGENLQHCVTEPVSATDQAWP
jgi:hypothetical protein